MDEQALYEALRDDRLRAAGGDFLIGSDGIHSQARRMGGRTIPNLLMGWFRDLTLPFFLKAGSGQSASWYSYKVDWNVPVGRVRMAM